MKSEDELERYLREFRPRTVRALTIPSQETGIGRKALAAAAIVLICVGSVLMVHRSRPPKVQPPAGRFAEAASPHVDRLSQFALTRMALRDDQLFQEQLSTESRIVLPNFRNPRSTLHVLSKE